MGALQVEKSLTLAFAPSQAGPRQRWSLASRRHARCNFGFVGVKERSVGLGVRLLMVASLGVLLLTSAVGAAAATITEFSVGVTPGSGPAGITAGPDGSLWFTENVGNRIGKITPSGVITEYNAGITANSLPDGISAGPDGNLWFTEGFGNRIGKITTAGVVTEYSAGITAGSQDRKSTRLNSSHSQISYAVFCLKKKKTRTRRRT